MNSALAALNIGSQSTPFKANDIVYGRN